MALRNIDTDLLRSFLAVVDQGGFSRAGNALGRSQSAISMQMKRLEDVLDTRLFRRVGRKMLLTPSGEMLLGYARKLVRLNDETLDALRESTVTGSVSLALMGDYATHVLPSVLADFMAQFPGIQIDVTTGFSADLMNHIGERYELVLATQPCGQGGEVLRTERTRWAYAERRELPSLTPLPLAVLPTGNLFREWALRALDSADIRWRVLFTSTSIATVEAAAAAGIAVTVVKEGTAAPGLRFLTERDGFPPLPDSEITLYRAPGKQSKSAEALADFLARALQSGHAGR